MSRRSYYSGFGAAALNHKLWLQAQAIERQRRAEKEAKEKIEVSNNQFPTNKKPASASTPAGQI